MHLYFCGLGKRQRSLDRNEEEERHIYKVNFETGEETLIYTANAFKIMDLIFANHTQQLIGVKLLADGEIINSFFNAERTNRSSSHNKITVDLGFSINKQFKLTYTESFRQAGQYHFHDLSSGKSKAVAYTYSHHKEALAGQQIAGTVNSAGLAIPYLLNLPRNNTPSPLIVMPHGGPIGVYDSPYFDEFTQFFVANGYAVLRVNFRGSAGFTSEFEDAGKLQWGNLMLADIQSAASEIVTRSDIDSNKACLFGGSYGGYAVTMLAIQYPDFYQCAVNVAGLSDLNLLIENSNHSERVRKWYKEQLIDAEINDSYSQQLKSISPVYLAADLKIPVMIAHGAKDTVVDIEHAYRLKFMLEKHKKTFEWLVLEDATHSFSNINDLKRLLGASADFIQRQLAAL